MKTMTNTLHRLISSLSGTLFFFPEHHRRACRQSFTPKVGITSIKNIKRLLFYCVIALCVHTTSAYAQQASVDILFYNVENLFDTIDDPITDDLEFLPEGKYKWSSERYLTKLDQLGRVISGDGKTPLPALVGLAEIENCRVLKDLVSVSMLKNGRYGIVQYDSPDERGIDVALIYRSDKFKVLYSRPLEVRLPWDLEFRTRDILYVQGILGSDTLHIYVNHWPSRRGGMEVSEPARMVAAGVLRTHLDSVAAQCNRFSAIIMGDLNDEPENRSVNEVLNAASPNTLCPPGFKVCLRDLSATFPEGEGSYYYWRDKKWNILDHIILSASLLDSAAALSVVPGSFGAVKEPWMLKEDEGRMIPFASFARDYEGGFSDHLPVKIALSFSEPPPPSRKRKWKK